MVIYFKSMDMCQISIRIVRGHESHGTRNEQLLCWPSPAAVYAARPDPPAAVYVARPDPKQGRTVEGSCTTRDCKIWP
jgi:hypothetical protein